ncbi:MAG: four-carbon acid sugar kinase family protein [Desulfobacterales bacterium]
MDDQRLPKDRLLNSLPPEWPHDLRPAIQNQIQSAGRKVVVLDDDPTGTQTVHGLPVLTEWSVEILAAELHNELPAFYILTNSRSLTLPDAQKLNAEIGYHLSAAAAQARRKFAVISRSDSTLRGHFPGEVAALSEALGQSFDGWIINPFFLEGGRYTVDDVHYVDEGGMLVPAAQTEFAQDRAFGYAASNLRDWIAEKTRGQIAAKDVASVSIADLRVRGPEAVTDLLMTLNKIRCCAVNAASYRDLEVFVQGLLAAEARDKRFLYRTAASFVQVRAGIFWRPLLTPDELEMAPVGGGLLVVGSYVPRSTRQIQALLSATDAAALEINVNALLADGLRENEIRRAVEIAEQALNHRNDIVIFTGRQLVTGKDSKSNLQIGQKVSQGLVDIVQRIRTAPRYILAKGGITASDIATRALNVKKAMVLGQILPGVPVWRLGEESRFAGLPYFVFPGNVGDDQALIEVVKQLKPSAERNKKPEPGA